MSNDNLSPGVTELLAENRELREKMNNIRSGLAFLAGRYESDNTVPLFEVVALLESGWSR